MVGCIVPVATGLGQLRPVQGCNAADVLEHPVEQCRLAQVAILLKIRIRSIVNIQDFVAIFDPINNRTC